MSEFIFHKVGQGLFYSGNLSSNYQFVFDCGTNNSKSLVQNEFSKLDNKVIDFVVISHLHKDHINCLQDLINNFNVKKIYLPYLRYEKNDPVSKAFIELLLWEGCYDSWYDHLEQADAENLEKDNSKIRWRQLYRTLRNIYIEGQDFWPKAKKIFNNKSEDSFTRINFVGKDTEEQFSELRIADSSDWFIKLYNKKISPIQLKDLKNKLSVELGKDTIEEYIDKRNYEKLKYIYEKVFGKKNLHLHSTAMLHYPIFNADKINETFYQHYEKLNTKGQAQFEKINSYCPYLSSLSLTVSPKNVRDYGKVQIGAADNYEIFKERPIKHEKPLTLLTGDILLENSLRQKIIQDINAVKNYYLFCQIPHHGSYDNWDSLDDIQKIIKKAIIPFGWGNEFGSSHTQLPNDKTIREINALTEIETILATQCNSYKYEIN